MGHMYMIRETYSTCPITNRTHRQLSDQYVQVNSESKPKESDSMSDKAATATHIHACFENHHI